MQIHRLIEPSFTPDYQALDGLLEEAQTTIEKRFLEGGHVFLSVAGLVGNLVTSLGALGASLNEDEFHQADTAIRESIGKITTVSQDHASREKCLEMVSVACERMTGQLEDMHEIMRYLQTFALTAKIAGAGTKEFEGFAAEILSQIASGQRQIDGFANQLQNLRKQLSLAVSSTHSNGKDNGSLFDTIIRKLQDNSRIIVQYHANMQRAVSLAAEHANAVQARASKVLTAMQIGDITRQRVEHMRQILDRVRLGPHDNAEKRRLRDSVIPLLAGQMQETCDDFLRETDEIIANISRLIHQFGDISKAQSDLLVHDQISILDVVATLESDLEQVGELLGGVWEINRRSDAVAVDTNVVVSDLLKGIYDLRTIKNDIFFMALNTNLRCSRLGDSGKAINVVAGELRVYAAKLEDSVNSTENELAVLNESSNQIRSMHDRLANGSVISLSDAKNAMHEARSRGKEIDRRAREQQSLDVPQIKGLFDRLGFNAGLSDTLQSCVQFLQSAAQGLRHDPATSTAELQALSEEIFSLYTMESERRVHIRYFPMPLQVISSEETASAQKNDANSIDDFIANALF